VKATLGRDALTVYTLEHARIHAGELFTAGVSSAALGAAGYLYMEVIVPLSLTRGAHLKAVEFYNSLAATFNLVEAPTITDGTTPVTILNRNRMSTRTSGLTIVSDPTLISAGTTLDTMNFTGSLLNNVGPQSSDIEWILKPGVKYLIRLQNNGGGNSTGYIKAHWYEPTA
jgi:hypothetical protein